MAVSAFALAAFSTTSKASLRSALNFGITNSVGAVMVLIAIALLYRHTGALNLAAMGRALSSAGPLGPDVVLAFALLTTGLLIKAAVVPFHFWLVDTASSAPLPLAMVLAGLLDALGVYGVARVYWTVFASPLASHHQVVEAVLIALGALSAAVGAAMALVLADARRRLGFVMVNHTGILLVGVGALSASGLAGAVVYAIGDGAAKVALFVGVSLVAMASSGARRSGRAILLAGGLALAGLPIFATGLAKSAMEDAAAKAGFPWVVPVLFLAAVVSGAAVFDVALNAGPNAGRAGAAPPVAGAEEQRAAAPARHGWRLPALLGSSLLAASVAALTLGRWATRAAEVFVDAYGYQQRVFGGPLATGLVVEPKTIGLSVAGGLVDILSALAAVALAWWVAARRRSRVGNRVDVGSRVVAIASRLHDGTIGDSMAWVTVGTAVVALVFAVRLG